MNKNVDLHIQEGDILLMNFENVLVTNMSSEYFCAEDFPVDLTQSMLILNIILAMFISITMCFHDIFIITVMTLCNYYQ